MIYHSKRFKNQNSSSTRKVVEMRIASQILLVGVAAKVTGKISDPSFPFTAGSNPIEFGLLVW